MMNTRKGNSKERERGGRSEERKVDISRTVSKIKEGKGIRISTGKKEGTGESNATHTGNMERPVRE